MFVFLSWQSSRGRGYHPVGRGGFSGVSYAGPSDTSSQQRVSILSFLSSTPSSLHLFNASFDTGFVKSVEDLWPFVFRANRDTAFLLFLAWFLTDGAVV